MEKQPFSEGKRIPRYKGMTEQSIRIQEEANPNIKRKLTFQYRSSLIEKWINQNFQLYGRTMDMRELSEYLQCGVGEIMKSIGKVGRGVWNEDINQTFLGLVTMVIKNGLVDRAQTALQVEAMVASQGQEYKAFISSTVNDALRTNQSANKGLMEALKLITPLLKTPSATPIQQTNIGIMGGGISQNEAVKIIEAQREMDLLNPLNEPERIKLIEANVQPDFPEVIATRQQGFSLAKEGQLPSKKPKKDHADRSNQTIIIS